jgi:hypothetical protein
MLYLIAFFPNSETQKHCFFYNLKSNFNTYLTSNHFMKKNYLSVAARQVMGATSTSGKGDTSYTTKTRTWRLLLTVFVVLFSLSDTQAQTISSYAFSTGTNGSLQDIAGSNTSYLVGLNDDTAGTVRAIGFDFLFMATTYTHFSANSNGQMQLHTSATASAIGNNVSTAANSAILAPFTGDNEVANGMRFSVLGSAPNRIFVMEWNQFYINYVNLSNAGNMQVWLNETTGVVTYIYGEIYNSSTSAQNRSIEVSS